MEAVAVVAIVVVVGFKRRRNHKWCVKAQRTQETGIH